MRAAEERACWGKAWEGCPLWYSLLWWAWRWNDTKRFCRWRGRGRAFWDKEQRGTRLRLSCYFWGLIGQPCRILIQAYASGWRLWRDSLRERKRTVQKAKRAKRAKKGKDSKKKIFLGNHSIGPSGSLSGPRFCPLRPKPPPALGFLAALPSPLSLVTRFGNQSRPKNLFCHVLGNV